MIRQTFGRALYRVRQFIVAVTSRYTKDDQVFAQKYLNIQQMAFFFQLPYYEKKHAVVVTKKMLSLAHGNPHIDERKLARIGLLHDIGKGVIKLSVLDKAVIVLYKFAFPFWYDRLASRGRKVHSPSIFRKFYVHKHHPIIGANMLRKIGDDEIADIISRHNYAARENDPMEFKLLQQVDSTY